MRHRRHSPTLLNLISLVLAMLVAVPVLAVVLNIFGGGTGDTWRHLLDTVLADYAVNSLILCLGVGICVGLLGTGAAWLVTHYE
ncbi:MAG: iron ABC transporter permease, partial [Rhodocyclaceae bacterium]|nr:iron ABC transporter permease [Rhodocyclaceae bacterium]